MILYKNVDFQKRRTFEENGGFQGNFENGLRCLVLEKVNSDVTSGSFSSNNSLILKVVHNRPVVKLQEILILSDNCYGIHQLVIMYSQMNSFTSFKMLQSLIVFHYICFRVCSPRCLIYKPATSTTTTATTEKGTWLSALRLCVWSTTTPYLCQLISCPVTDC